MMLSDHFRLGEFIESETARRYHIDNTPSWETVLHLRHLCREVLQPLRRHHGGPIRIVSGYRCEELNERVHGVGNSQHLYGCAADLHLPDLATGREWYYWIVSNLDFDQLLLRNREGTDRGSCREIGTDAVKQFLGFFVGFCPADERADHKFMTDKNVLCGRQIGVRGSMLINSGNTMLQSHERVMHDNFLAVQNDFTAVRLVNACQRFDKSGFPRAIFTYDGVNLAFFQIETDIIKCFDARKDLCNMIHFEQIFSHLHPSPGLLICD